MKEPCRKAKRPRLMAPPDGFQSRTTKTPIANFKSAFGRDQSQCGPSSKTTPLMKPLCPPLLDHISVPPSNELESRHVVMRTVGRPTYSILTQPKTVTRESRIITSYHHIANSPERDKLPLLRHPLCNTGLASSKTSGWLKIQPPPSLAIGSTARDMKTISTTRVARASLNADGGKTETLSIFLQEAGHSLWVPDCEVQPGMLMSPGKDTRRIGLKFIR
jgi:hypothetical protein